MSKRREYEVMFIDAADRAIGLEMVESESFIEALDEVKNMVIPERTVGIQVTEACECAICQGGVPR